MGDEGFEDVDECVNLSLARPRGESIQSASLCEAWQASRPIILFAMRWMPATWRTVINVLVAGLDAQCAAEQE